ncbi:MULTISPECIES: ABC-three component system protein [unclassified Chromobacterium]|uniref:ABC-three component system protein n=1 Tax=unclassified Chromobacterium TaxID=2641838 RepID=UPI001F16121A|nr:MULTISPECIES: ABC-three component system protein [unclassified Chromobacterium]MCP1292938.1 hypothetical protein [Chromobacterium sp. S0633]UJB31618.1 hypothetical protein HQN78_11385 [Chromobacterium sp. Beijing]
MLTQKGNQVAGNLVGGNYNENNNYNYRPRGPLDKLYEKLKNETKDDEIATEIHDKLQHYCNKLTSGDVRGLEDKLKSANREDLLIIANHLKQEATMLIMRTQTSPTAQTILTYLLTKLYTQFVLHAQPAVMAEKSRIEVDAIISDKVINPVEEILGDNDLNITPSELLGFIYFLGGNCHVRWDKC